MAYGRRASPSSFGHRPNEFARMAHRCCSGGLAGRDLRTGQGFEMIGFQPGRLHAVIAGLAEIGGGVLLASGFVTPLSAAIIFAVMIVAAFSVHIKTRLLHHKWRLRILLRPFRRSGDACLHGSRFAVSRRLLWLFKEWGVVGIGCHTRWHHCQHYSARSKTSGTYRCQMTVPVPALLLSRRTP
jgi:DoxX